MPAGVALEASPDGRRLTLRATTDLHGVATGRFSDPVAAGEWPAGDLPADVELLGFAFTQFALPVVAGADLAFDFAPAPDLRSPRAMLPLLVRTDAGCILLAPTTNPHEQIITVRDGALVWGWHGDLDDVPAGFATELGVYRGGSATEVLHAWGEDVRTGVPARTALADHPLTSHLSYWTDNGAAYWYRTEPGRTIAASVIAAVGDLRDRGVPVRAVELDSWWYEHAIPRPITEIGYPDDVPPTGTRRWQPRADAFGPTDRDPFGPTRPDLVQPARPDPVAEVAAALGGAPLVLHARHISPDSPYVTEGVEHGEAWWIDDLAAHPADPGFFRRWFDDAARWGACCIEQDWMLVSWFGVRALRSVPGRALAWQRALDHHARETGVGLLWCMATPADLITAVALPAVIAVRTCDDYRFADDPAVLWIWFLTVNRLADVLGLPAFKDCFFSNAAVGDADDPIDGDRHAEVEALLAAFSAGPAGVGDRIGRTDRDLVVRVCDDDGRLRHPDRPIGMVDDCLFGAPARGERLAWATTTSTTPEGTWTYVVAINVAEAPVVVDDALRLTDIGIEAGADVAIYDWRTRRVVDTDATISCSLGPRDWTLHVVCPTGPDGPVVGDPERYVTMPSGYAYRSGHRSG